MNNVLKCVMWIVSAIVAITGIVITKDMESAIWIMMIPLATSIFIQWKIYFKGEYKIMEYKTLKDTVDIMCSTDYKERFIAEYKQLEIRILWLERMLDNWDHNELNFKPTCPRSTYDLQLRAMKDYYAVLQMISVMDNIPIDVE